MARRILTIFCASTLLVQTITCQCVGNPYNGPYPGPGIIPEVGYPDLGCIGNNYVPDIPFGAPGCYNPGLVNDIPFPGSGIYNPAFGNDLGLPGPTVLNGFAPDCGLYPEIGFGGPAIFNPAIGPEFVPCGAPIGPIGPPAFTDIGIGGPGCLGLAPEVGFGPGFVGPNLPGPYPNFPCQNFAPSIPIAPTLGPLSPIGLDVPLGLPCSPMPQIFPVIDPSTFTAPFSMPPTGMSIYSDDLIIEGPVLVSGRMPFLGAVTMEGAFSSAGAGAVSYGCGDSILAAECPATATLAPSFGFAPALPLGLQYGGFPAPGLGCANRVY
ncbi:hypothetical protein K1T71_014197 [Dendrolimus kikuchii]|uniref:Uncharacterized protein n=1 Tax=Dendrolimus kikuchii TaxID=765133 RepID=A0ACC1CFD8_9NEOP|nr:hypothetical protein K1T71_014197 [Dendrolimus kikuchii]